MTAGDDKDDLVWELDGAETHLQKFKSHLARKSFDKISEYESYQNMKEHQMKIIIDYGQKWETHKNKESQSFQFGKAGLSNYGATC